MCHINQVPGHPDHQYPNYLVTPANPATLANFAAPARVPTKDQFHLVQVLLFLGGGYKLVGAKDSSKSIEKFWKSGFIMEQTPLKLGDLSRTEQNG